jgi:glutathione synthase/RimK-type ligase-like ATP-grasp enzyme
MILLLSNKWALSVDFIVAELGRRNHSFLRLNSEDLVSESATARLPDLRVAVSKGGTVKPLDRRIQAVWNRRPGKPFDDTPHAQRPSPAIQRFVNDQWYSFLECLQLLPSVGWVNHPHANDAMESKIRQLHLAEKHGFRIPETVITNDPNEVRSLLAAHPAGLVAKALYSPLIEEADQDLFVFTSELAALPTDADPEIHLAPIIFQRSLTPKTDFRVTVVGDVAFPVRIDLRNESAGQIDWRTVTDSIDFTPCELPSELLELCISYVHKNGLAFGALDLVEHENDFFFLEINPNGEWAWLQAHGVPIANALCDLLVRFDLQPNDQWPTM